MDWLARGGIFVAPILIFSVVALGIFLERLWVLRRSQIFPHEKMEEISALLVRRKTGEAGTLCHQVQSPVTSIVLAGLQHVDSPLYVIKEVVEERGKVEALELRKYLGLLQTIASVCPLLGLLGTVSGMIKVFDAISIEGVGNPGSLATGISEALISTAAGLSVAIPTFLAQRYLASRADSLIYAMEEYAAHMYTILTRIHSEKRKEGK